MFIKLGKGGPNDPTDGLRLTEYHRRFLQRLLYHNWLWAQDTDVKEQRQGEDRETFLRWEAQDLGGNYLILFNRFFNLRKRYLAKRNKPREQDHCDYRRVYH